MTKVYMKHIWYSKSYGISVYFMIFDLGPWMTFKGQIKVIEVYLLNRACYHMNLYK